MSRFDSQRGSVMLLAMVILLVLLTIGYTTIHITSGEIDRAGFRRYGARAFMNAESALAEIKTSMANFNPNVSTTTVSASSSDIYHGCGRVTYRGETAPPPGVSVSMFTGHLFEVEVSGYGLQPTESVHCPNNKEFARKVREGVVRIVPRAVP